MENRPKVLMIITLDTKEVEARYLRKCLEDSGLEVYHLDASIRRAVDAGADITPDQIAAAAGKTMSEVRALNHEGKCLEIMIQGAIPVRTRWTSASGSAELSARADHWEPLFARRSWERFRSACRK